MSTKVPMTPEGKRQLEIQLENLLKVERPKIIAEIEEARAHGDLKENAEYHAAKEKQGFVEKDIRELKAKIANAEVIDPHSLSGDRVVFGATVTLFYIDSEQEKTFKIVGEDEADIALGKINYSSPIARAMIGREVGDEIQIHTPGGVHAAEISDVEFR